MAIDPNNLAGTAKLTFADEFTNFNLWNGTSGTWQASYAWADVNASGTTNTANNELQWYINPFYGPTSSVNPFSVSNGVLDIQAMPASAAIEAITGYPYTSGIITTAHSFSQTYGYFEMRAQLPAGQGIWPAFWMLPSDGSWPPEIDVMELIGSEPNNLYNFIHYGNDQVADGVTPVTGMTTGFHTYGVDWESDFITWYFDGTEVSKLATPSSINKPMYMLADLAVGGNWPGSPDDTTPFPADLKIDYIRAYSALTTSNQHLFDLPVSGAATHFVTGTARNEVLSGTSGNDFFDSWGGADRMTGGAGDDQYLNYNARSVIIEAANGGIDTVLSGSSGFTLPNYVENITLVGNGGRISNGSQSAVGNSLDNRMESNSTTYANKLNGGAGNDQLLAGNAADSLTGGAGGDEFVFRSLPTRAGHITDFTVGTDVVDLRGIFTKASYTGSDPLTDHHLILTPNSSGGTNLAFDADGTGAGASVNVTILDHILPTTLHLQADIWFV